MKPNPFPSSCLKIASRLLALLCLFCLLLAGARPAAALDLDALVGFGQSASSIARYRQGTWNPLTVYITGPGVNGNAQLHVLVRTGDQTTTYTRQVSLRDVPNLNETESFVFQLPSPDYYGFRRGNIGSTDILVQLFMDGRKLKEKRVALPTPIQPESYTVLALTRDGSGMNFLAHKKLSLFHRHYNPVNYLQMRGGFGATATTQVMYTLPSALPAMPQGYAPIDALVLADQPLDNLSEDQIAALKGYVREGGLLIVSGGGDMPRLKSAFFNEMLPLAPSGASLVNTLPELEKRYKAPLPLHGTVALTEGALKPDAYPLFGATGRKTPLISARPYGSGIVVFTTFDFLDPNIRAWRGAPALWYDLLRCGNEAISPRQILASGARSPQGDQQLNDALAGRQAANTPPFHVVALFLAAYILLLVPVSYLILKKLDKREYAWITSPLLILGFTVVSYLIALSIKGGLLTVNRVVVLESVANSDKVAGYAQMTLYSPRRAGYDIAFGDPGDPNNPYRLLAPGEVFHSSLQGLSSELTVAHDTTTTIQSAQVRLWDKRSFDTPVITDLGGPIEVKTEVVGSPVPNVELPTENPYVEAEGDDARPVNTPRVHPLVQVIVTNKTRYHLTNCAILAGQQSVPVGDLAPGETKKIGDLAQDGSGQSPLRWAYHDGANGISLPDPGSVPANTSPDVPRTETREMTLAKIRAATVQALASTQNGQNYYNPYGDEGSYGKVTNAFVGWFYDPLLPIQVDGQPAKGEEVNLLFVHLPQPSNASHGLRAAVNPFDHSPQLKIEDEEGGPRRNTMGVFK